MSGQATKNVLCRNIGHDSLAPPENIPPGYVGTVVLPGTGRLIWWTGRVSIGLRYQPRQHFEPATQSACWIRELMLKKSQAKSRIARSAS